MNKDAARVESTSSFSAGLLAGAGSFASEAAESLNELASSICAVPIISCITNRRTSAPLPDPVAGAFSEPALSTVNLLLLNLSTPADERDVNIAIAGAHPSMNKQRQLKVRAGRI